jgi:mevalonate kinase
MSLAFGEAPAKILLMGEHSVVYGHPAIAIPLRSVHARAEVELTRNGGIDLLAPDLAGQAGAERLTPRIRVSSTIPVGRGMGSGAAVAVAIVRGICAALGRRLDSDQVSELTMVSETAFHGRPSGVDSAVVSRDEAIYFVPGKPIQRIDVGPGRYHFVAADTGIDSPTIRVVEEVRRARELDRARYDSFLWELGSMTSVAREVIRTGSPEELGMCMNHAQKCLQALGVSCPELDALIRTAIENGALGAKLSGAGRGGVMIALLKSPDDEGALEAKLRLAGAENVFTTMLGGSE